MPNCLTQLGTFVLSISFRFSFLEISVTLPQKMKYMKAIHICLAMMAIALVACSGGSQSNSSELKKEEVQFETYQMPDDLLASERELKLSELADSVWYVPLETKPECVLAEKFDHFRYRNHRFYVMDDYSKTVHVFSDEGKFLHRIGNKGQGPKEFYWCYQLVVDGHSLYILDMLNRIKKYDLEGNWTKDIKLTKQPYRLLSLEGGKLACYISDDQFPKKEDAYSWLILNAEGDSVTCINTHAWRENKVMQNYWVENEFSTQYPMTYKEAYNDSLYYFASDTCQPVAYGVILPGKHRLPPELIWKEVKKASHGLRISYIHDTPRYLIFNYKCMCTEGIQGVLLGAFDKKTGGFFNIFNRDGEPKITNDLGGPDFIPLACVYPDRWIGMAESHACPDEFAKQYQIKPDDNQVLVMVKCKTYKK